MIVKATKDLQAKKPSPPSPAESRPIKPSEKSAQPERPSSKSDKDTTTLSAETTEKKASNLPNLQALSESLDDKSGNKAETGDAKKYPPEVQQKLDSLERQLKEAEKKGDKEAVERLKKELEELRNPSGKTEETPDTENGGVPPAGNASAPIDNGGASSGGGTPSGGGAPSGGAAPAAGGGAPASGGGAPSGAAPAGGANEAGAGQGAGKQEIDQFISFAAEAYGVNPTLLSEIARRESNFNTGEIPNNWDSNAKKGTPSKGMFQFIEPTFKSMMPQAKQANPQAWEGVSENWTDWKAQALTTAWAISAGKGSHWSTYKAALQTAGGNPRAQ